MAANDSLTPEHMEFLAKCEEELKDRFTEKDEEFMKVYNLEYSVPPIIESWWVPNNSGWRNNRRNNRRQHPYERHGGGSRGGDAHRDRDRGNYDGRDRERNYHNNMRGYNDAEYEGRRHPGYNERRY